MNSVVVFDLGKVLVDFDYSITIRKIAANSPMPLEGIKDLIEQSPLLVHYETGLLTRREFFEQVRKATGFRGTIEEFGGFFADIFSPISPMIEMHAGLRRQKIPAYIFSNTNDLAIEHIRRNFPFFKNFDGYIFSHEVGAMKPDKKIYEALETMTGKCGAEIFYIDDRPENIEAGNARGWRTILHESPKKSRTALNAFGFLK